MGFNSAFKRLIQRIRSHPVFYVLLVCSEPGVCAQSNTQNHVQSTGALQNSKT